MDRRMEIPKLFFFPVMFAESSGNVLIKSYILRIYPGLMSFIIRRIKSFKSDKTCRRKRGNFLGYFTELFLHRFDLLNFQ